MHCTLRACSLLRLFLGTECGPLAWAEIKRLHAPTTAAASLTLEKELSALRLGEGEPVQPVLDKLRELYAKLAFAGVTYVGAKCVFASVCGLSGT